MNTVATLLDTAGARQALRRSLPVQQSKVRGCRTPAALVGLLETTLVDAVVVGPGVFRRGGIDGVRRRFPGIPLVVFGPVRPDDVRPLLNAVQAVLVEGVDDPMAGTIVTRNGYLANRRNRLAHLPRLLRLTEPLQVRAFDLLLAQAGPPAGTDGLASSLGVSREHLSRQFAAGGAPNLKRIIGLLAVLTARDLLLNPGYTAASVATLLGFGRPSRLRETVNRVAGMSIEDLGRPDAPDPIRRFLGARSRSRR